MREWRQKYHRQKVAARLRGIEFLFVDFDQWFAVWKESGRRPGLNEGGSRWCMARKGDIGPYEPDNVYIATLEQNNADAGLAREKSVKPCSTAVPGGE